MNRGVSLLVLLILLAAACKNKTTGDESSFFPVLSYLQSQIRQIDTSLYSIVKMSKAHGIADTAYLRREEFKTAARDFLSLPDLAKTGSEKYTETKLYDEDLKKVVISYVPKDKTDIETITRQDVIIEPGNGASDQVQTIYIETVLSDGDSTVQKRLTWNVAKNFQVVKLINKKGQPETVETTDVIWSGGQ